MVSSLAAVTTLRAVRAIVEILVVATEAGAVPTMDMEAVAVVAINRHRDVETSAAASSRNTAAGSAASFERYPSWGEPCTLEERRLSWPPREPVARHPPGRPSKCLALPLPALPVYSATCRGWNADCVAST